MVLVRLGGIRYTAAMTAGLNDSPNVSPIRSRREAAFEVVGGDCARGLILLCDHASNAIPRGHGTLGLPKDQLERHIAYDIGAAAVTREIAARLGVPAILSRYSRLFIDLNRGADDPTLVMRISDGAVVPGNRDLDDVEIARRVDAFHTPYHAAVTELIERVQATGKAPVLLSVHSFTDRWKTTVRPWHITVLRDRDVRFAKPLLQALEADAGLVVAENEPYSGELTGDSMNRHGTQRGLAHALIEIRQDLIREMPGQLEWAARIAGIVDGLLLDEALAGVLHQVVLPTGETRARKRATHGNGDLQP